MRRPPGLQDVHEGYPMNNLREARIRAGLSQGELAEKVGVTQATISNWELGKGKPPDQKAIILKTVLDLGDSPVPSGESSLLATWLTKARLVKGWSVPELAHYSGLTPPA